MPEKILLSVECFTRSPLLRSFCLCGIFLTSNDLLSRNYAKFLLELEIGLILFDPLVTLEELQTNINILKETGFWRYSGQIFSFLRPQVGTPYVTLLRHHNLLGELQVNTAEYTASYQDHRVSRIVQQCKIWNRKYQHMYMMLCDSSRSDLGTGGFKRALERYRSVQPRFLESALAQYAQTDLSCKILIIDPRAEIPLQIYTHNRFVFVQEPLPAWSKQRRSASFVFNELLYY